jgi:hypothetical protein
MRKYEFHLLIGLHAQIAKALGDITDPTKWTDATGPVVPKNPYIVDTRATTQIPAIADLQLAINYMTMDNTWSAYGPYMETAKPLPTGRYVNTSMENLAIICNPTLKAYIQSNLHNWSVRDKQKFDKFIEQFIAYPVQYVNPLDNTMKSLNFLNNNQVLIIEKKYVDRIYNYAKELSQYFAQNDTVRYVNKLREVVGAYKFTSVCLFECDGLLKVVEPYAPA